MTTQSVFSVAKGMGLALLMMSGDAALAGDTPAAQIDRGRESAQVQRGRYLVQISGCNDCHTHGYTESNGAIDEQRWLLGSSLGWQGPWGTTYPANLRLVLLQPMCRRMASR